VARTATAASALSRGRHLRGVANRGAWTTVFPAAALQGRFFFSLLSVALASVLDR